MPKDSTTRLAIGALVFAGLAQAQQPTTPPVSQRPAPGRIEIPGSHYEIVFGMAEWIAGPLAERRTQAGVVTVYIVDGEFRYLIDGQPGPPYKVGDLAQIPERAFPIDGAGSGAAAAMAVYIVERPKP